MMTQCVSRAETRFGGDLFYWQSRRFQQPTGLGRSGLKHPIPGEAPVACPNRRMNVRRLNPARSARTAIDSSLDRAAPAPQVPSVNTDGGQRA